MEEKVFGSTQQSGKIKDCTDYRMKTSYTKTSDSINEPGSFLKVLSLFIPLLGFGLFFAFKDEFPKSSKTCLTLALVNIAVSSIISFLLLILPILVYFLKG